MHLRRVLLWSIALLCLLSMGFGPPCLTDSDYAQKTVTLEQLRAARSAPIPDIDAQASILVDLVTGRILYAKNEHERRAPASLTKLVSAVVALEHGDLNQEMLVWPVDLAKTTRAGLSNGERLTMQQLLGLMLICSDNAAANAVARNLSGGNDDTQFVAWMNELVARWELQDTHFTNAHGLDAPDHYSTAYDLAIIARNAMLIPFIAEVVALPNAYIGEHQVVSTNELLRSYNGIVGVKTGTTDNAGESFIGMAVRPQGRVLVVILNSINRFQDAALLMDYYFSNFYGIEITLKGSSIDRYQDKEGNWHQLSVRDTYTNLLTAWQLHQVNIYRRIDNPATEPEPDTPVGALEIYLARTLLAEIPLYAN